MGDRSDRKCFSPKGIRLAIEHLRTLGVEVTKVFYVFDVLFYECLQEIYTLIPSSCRDDPTTIDKHILEELEAERLVTFTPTRKLTNGLLVAPDNDRYAEVHRLID